MYLQKVSDVPNREAILSRIESFEAESAAPEVSGEGRSQL